MDHISILNGDHPQFRGEIKTRGNSVSKKGNRNFHVCDFLEQEKCQTESKSERYEMSKSYDILGGRSGNGGELRSVAEVRFSRATVVGAKLIPLFESVLFYLPPQGSPIEAQFFGCFDAISIVFLQRPLDDF